MAITLAKKGQKIDLTKGRPNLRNVAVGLGWDVPKFDGVPKIDLDATCFLLNSQGKCDSDNDVVYYNSKRHVSGAVTHSGDNRTGAGNGDDETINIDLAKMPNNVDKMSFVVTMHDAIKKAQTFGQVDNAYVRVYDKDTGEDLIRYDLGEDFSVETSLLTAQLYKKNGEWCFHAVGQGYQKGLDAFVREYGLEVANQPQVPNINGHSYHGTTNTNYRYNKRKTKPRLSRKMEAKKVAKKMLTPKKANKGKSLALNKK